MLIGLAVREKDQRPTRERRGGVSHERVTRNTRAELPYGANGGAYSPSIRCARARDCRSAADRRLSARDRVPRRPDRALGRRWPGNYLCFTPNDRRHHYVVRRRG